ncbi:epoxide hydrolase family protein [Natronolimnohabitans innermongolicus]|uniref:Epoxide hydrolase n=1 Tax=Natronolimnohabitans innermongolicus JCM 12255 TaxID=1227499 RepID=L9WKV9_9EURY|nr:epoxide hydrolase [Natronolimnohabitans innermongolicus]ELY50130.1 epoxide hydrolase [Natronolimnohabitans innermongolicus JCM 12255]
MTATDSIDPFEVDVDRSAIDDLRDRLAETRWPDQLPDADWEYGTDRVSLQDLCEYWRTEYDWNGFEDRFNEFDQYVTTIDGQRIHFYHVRSPESDATPLLMPHGWPGSVAEFLEVFGPLSDPAAHGGDPADAFHVVAPSLPGYGFSGPTDERGYDVAEMAAAFDRLMDRLEYDGYVVQGGDWGALIAAVLGANYPDRVDAIHANMLFSVPSRLDDPVGMVDEAEMDAYRETSEFYETGFGYHEIQSTRPQTLAYGLTDSPAGLAGWIVEKFREWSDGDDVDAAFGRDRLLDNISVYWLTGTINSSMRLYYETDVERTVPESVDVPTGHARYPAEIIKTPRSWAEETYDIARWNELPEGGHFAAMEVPDLFVEEVRSFVREVDVR